MGPVPIALVAFAVLAAGYLLARAIELRRGTVLGAAVLAGVTAPPLVVAVIGPLLS
jgi:hypothetical protein